MKTYILTLAAGLQVLASLTACNRDKPAAEQAATVPAADTAVVLSNRDTAAYRANALRLAQRVGQDLGITDAVVITRLVPVYVTREAALADLDQRYTADTAGRYAARRAANDAATARVRSIITDPAQYNTYTSNQSRYYEGPYSVTAVETDSVSAPATATAPRATPARRPAGPRIVKYEKDKDGEVKIEYSNGKKVKIEADGDTKVKYADGRKVKVEDGVRKVKD